MTSGRLRNSCIGVAAFVVAAAGCSKNAAPPSASSAVRPAAAAPASAGPDLRFIAADLPLLPPGIMNPARPPAMTKAVYEFAARHPEVLNYVPCFCGCERGGHTGNHDCFIAGRDKAGKVTSWEAHGLGCQVCIDVGYEAMQLHNSGASVSDIRAAIDKRYANEPLRTPTPVPARGGHEHQ